MPIMVPPGQGITVTTPVGQEVQPAASLPVQSAPQAQPRQQANPSPFRQVHGPDLVLMPHHQGEEKLHPPQDAGQPGIAPAGATSAGGAGGAGATTMAPAQFSRGAMLVGKLRRLSRRGTALKLNATPDDLSEIIRQHITGENPLASHVLTDALYERARNQQDLDNAALWHWYQTAGLPAALREPAAHPDAGNTPGGNNSQREYEGAYARMHGYGPKVLQLFNTALQRAAEQTYQNNTSEAPDPAQQQQIAVKELAAIGALPPVTTHPDETPPPQQLLISHGVDPTIPHSIHAMDAKLDRISHRSDLSPTGMSTEQRDPENFVHPIDSGRHHIARIAKAFHAAVQRHLPNLYGGQTPWHEDVTKPHRPSPPS